MKVLFLFLGLTVVSLNFAQEEEITSPLKPKKGSQSQIKKHAEDKSKPPKEPKNLPSKKDLSSSKSKKENELEN
jgi:hypothetical protein